MELAGHNPAERVAVARQTLRHQLGIAGIHRFHCLCCHHANKQVLKRGEEVTKKRDYRLEAITRVRPVCGVRAILRPYRKTVWIVGIFLLWESPRWFQSVRLNPSSASWPGSIIPGTPGILLDWIVTLTLLSAIGLVFAVERKKHLASLPTVELVSDTNPKSFWITDYQLRLKNNSNHPMQNIRAEIVSISPEPHQFSSWTFPVELRGHIASNILNPQSSGLFDLIRTERPGQNRVITFTNKDGDILQVNFGFHETLGNDKHQLQLQLSCSEFPTMGVVVEILCRADRFDALSLPTTGGCEVTITKLKT